jgi:ribosomal protein S18 acetylase RimI-like enzyme
LSGRYDEFLGAQPWPIRPFFEWLLQIPYVEHERDTVALERDGELCALGFAIHDPATEDSAMYWFGMVDPRHQGHGLGAWLIDWAHAVVAQRDAERFSAIRSEFPAEDAPAHELFGHAGYGHVRTSWDMARTIDGALERPAPPVGVTIRRFEPGRDERTWWAVTEAAFSENFGFVPAPYESWAGEWYETDDWNPSRVLLAEAAGEVVGELAWVDAQPDGYVANLGVLASHRRRGIGSALLQEAFADISEQGFARASLTVDTENTTGAVGLYRNIGLEPVREGHVFERGAT